MAHLAILGAEERTFAATLQACLPGGEGKRVNAGDTFATRMNTSRKPLTAPASSAHLAAVLLPG